MGLQDEKDYWQEDQAATLQKNKNALAEKFRDRVGTPIKVLDDLDEIAGPKTATITDVKVDDTLQAYFEISYRGPSPAHPEGSNTDRTALIKVDDLETPAFKAGEPIIV